MGLQHVVEEALLSPGASEEAPNTELEADLDDHLGERAEDNAMAATVTLLRCTSLTFPFINTIVSRVILDSLCLMSR
jgi:hypothetical protein